MPDFSRRTIIAAVATLEQLEEADFDRFMLEHALEGSGADLRGRYISIKDRANCLIEFLLQNPDAEHFEGGNLTNVLIRDLVLRANKRAYQSFYRTSDPLEERYPELLHALKRDGFEIEEGVLRRVLPETLDLPKADDEVHALLRKFGFLDPTLGHLEQAIQNHGQGNWASANSQLRSFVDALLDDIAGKLVTNSSQLPPSGYQRVILLSNLVPPFLSAALNEWSGDGKGFIEGFRRRLHPQGSHPGLSDEDDCTFRLHLVLVVARLLLRRLDALI